MSKVYRGMMFNDECRFYLTKANDILEQINNQTTYSPTAIAALGRSMMITNILGLMQKGDAKVTTIINGGGEIGTIIGVADSKGHVKAKVSNQLVNPPKIHDTKLNVGEAVGKNGYLRVIKDLNLKEPFVGEVPIISGEIGMDYANYFMQSEQIPTAVAVGVLVDKDHSIKNACCFIVQLMPGASEKTIKKLEEAFSKFNNISNILSNIDEKEFLEQYFPVDYTILEEIETTFSCDCSYDKFFNALQMLPPSDILELKQDKVVECVCDFCHKKYEVKSFDI